LLIKIEENAASFGEMAAYQSERVMGLEPTISCLGSKRSKGLF